MWSHNRAHKERIADHMHQQGGATVKTEKAEERERKRKSIDKLGEAPVSAIPALRRLRQADGEFNPRLGYTAIPCLMEKKITD